MLHYLQYYYLKLHETILAIRISIFRWLKKSIPMNGIGESCGSSIFHFFWEMSILFSILAAPIYTPTNSAQGHPFLHILTNICYLFILMISILIVVRWYLIMILICISLMIKDVKDLCMCLWLSEWNLWKTVYLDLLPI